MGITYGDIALALMEIDKRVHHLERKVAALEIKEAAKHRTTNKVRRKAKS